jgi:DNA gyrase/topoisomerase IV subunit B
MKAVRTDGDNPVALLQAILSKVKINDPQFRGFIKEEFNKFQKRKEQKEISQEIIRRLRIQNKKLLEQVASLREQLKHSRADRNEVMSKLNYLMKLNTSLAEALGSCNNCWGDDPECTICSGEGYPGWRNINKRLFNLYVLPSLEKLVCIK